ncbi:MAG TPA: glycosyltransferase family 2 protein [Gemmataceae bacterium]|nr:glycosyltransferase family 2 protein [Gemmataceae bacterium]
MEHGPAVELSVILPAYNEGEAVAHAIERYAACLPGFCESFEIIVVNDGSTDDTGTIAARAAADRPYVRVLSNPRNLGQVASMLRGFAESRGRVLTHNGVDLPFAPEDTGKLLECLRQGADVVVAQRIHRRAYGVTRKVISWCNILLVKAMFRSPFTDHNFVQAYRREVLDAITVESAGVSTVTTELILKALRQGFHVRSLPADYQERRTGRSTVTLAKIARTMKELLKLWGIMRRPMPSLAGASRPRPRSNFQVSR